MPSARGSGGWPGVRRGSRAAGEPGCLCPRRLLLVFWRSPPVAQLQQLPSHLQRAPAAESRSPSARAAGCGLAPSLPLLSQSHPELGLGRAERGHRVAGLCPGGDCGGQSAGGRGRPVAHAPLPRGRPARPAARSCGRLRDLASVSRGVESLATQREGGKVPVPSAMLRAF